MHEEEPCIATMFRLQLRLCDGRLFARFLLHFVYHFGSPCTALKIAIKHKRALYHHTQFFSLSSHRVDVHPALYCGKHMRSEICMSGHVSMSQIHSYHLIRSIDIGEHYVFFVLSQ